jgi:hypothetical protein
MASPSHNTHKHKLRRHVIERDNLGLSRHVYSCRKSIFDLLMIVTTPARLREGRKEEK